jgi:hypothetical protein
MLPYAAMLPVAASRAAGLLLLACTLAIVFTHPLAAGLSRLGRFDTGDGHWSIWCVNWVAHALTTRGTSLFDANIFFPERNTLAYSESNLVAGVVGIPAYLLTRNPMATHNSVVLIAFVLAFLSAYALAHHVSRHRGAAIVAGIAFAYCPFTFARLAHIQLLMTFGLPLVLLAMHKLEERPSVARGLALAMALAIQALACGYYGILAGLTVGLGILWFAVTRGRWRQWKYWAAVLTAAVVSVGVVVPFFLVYIEVQRDLGFGRTLGEAAAYSGNWQAWLASSAHAHRWLQRLLARQWSEVLFPGFLTTALGLTGAALIWRRLSRESAPDQHYDVAGFYVLAGVIAFWTTFGPKAGLYALLFETVPLFAWLRAPARFGILVTLSLAMLMAMGLARWLRNASTTRQWLVSGGLALAMAAELLTAPLALREADPLPAAYRLLGLLPRAPVAMFPFYHRRGEFPRHAWYMSGSAYHWQPLVNGYSDNIPPRFRKEAFGLSTFPSRGGFALLRRHNARYVVFHLDWYDYRNRELLKQRLEAYRAHLRPISRERFVWLYEIVSWPGQG